MKERIACDSVADLLDPDPWPVKQTFIKRRAEERWFERTFFAALA